MAAQHDQSQDNSPQDDDRIEPSAAGQEPGGGEVGLDPLEALQASLDLLKQENAEMQEQMLRAAAEVENTRRRTQEEIAKARKFGIESFAESLVPVKDSLEAALAQPDQTTEAWRAGVETTLRQLITAFERHRLAEIAPAVGDRFDPHQHQAISTVPCDQPANTVVQVLQKGYLIADRVLRPALVTVAA
ncbi:MAG: nucleotide exchange factor GrpE [Pigmentiphaga sp.]|nr:nucleotide exchange factor GrpE [Pigmentiphaga sp.]